MQFRTNSIALLQIFECLTSGGKVINIMIILEPSPRLGCRKSSAVLVLMKSRHMAMNNDFLSISCWWRVSVVYVAMSYST